MGAGPVRSIGTEIGTDMLSNANMFFRIGPGRAMEPDPDCGGKGAKQMGAAAC